MSTISHANRLNHNLLGAGFHVSGDPRFDATKVCDGNRLFRLIGGNKERKSRTHIERAVGLGVVQFRLALHECEHGRHGWHGVNSIGEFAGVTQEFAPTVTGDVDAVIDDNARFGERFGDGRVERGRR